MVTTFSDFFLDFLVTQSNKSSSYLKMSTTNDQHYIEKILNKDTQAFAVLVDRYKNMVFTLALQMVKNREEAEEVAQDAFVKVYRFLEKFKGDSKFSTWIYKITYNTCLDYLKKNKRQIGTVTIDEFTERQIKTMDNALDVLEQNEQKQLIQQCLQLLPSEESVLLRFFYFDELSLKEISTITNTTVSNLKVKLFRSRKN